MVLTQVMQLFSQLITLLPYLTFVPANRKNKEKAPQKIFTEQKIFGSLEEMRFTKLKFNLILLTNV